MKGNLADEVRLKHINDAIIDIKNFTKGIIYEEYINNYQLRLALVKLLENIGEASALLSEETKNRFSEIDWRILKVVRNILVHEYFGINYELVWEMIQKHIPELEEKITTILKVFPENDGI